MTDVVIVDVIVDVIVVVVQVEYIVEMLQKYISVEEKDAHHCIKHFVKIRSRDTQAAQEMLPATIEHITLIRYGSVSSHTVSTCSTVSYL